MQKPGAEHALQALWWPQAPHTPAQRLVLGLLRPLCWLYGGLSGIHRWLYRTGLKRRQHAPVPVVVVGNLIAGGAGKTPTVIALVQALQARGYQPGVVSRGYGRRGRQLSTVTQDSPASQVGDEPLLIHRRTGVPVMVWGDRAAAAEALCAANPGVDVIVTDDGLQHHRLHRDFEFWVFDERGIGNGHWLPAGPLRQTLPTQLPPHTTVLYNAPAPSTPLPGFAITRRLSGARPLQAWWAGASSDADAIRTLQALSPSQLVAAAGMANPERFFSSLRDWGLAFTPLPLPDHHAFSALPWPAGTPHVIVTEKDAVKLSPTAIGNTQVWVAMLDCALPASSLEGLWTALPPPSRPRPTRPEAAIG